jgi:hypothetical protein
MKIHLVLFCVFLNLRQDSAAQTSVAINENAGCQPKNKKTSGTYQ